MAEENKPNADDLLKSLLVGTGVTTELQKFLVNLGEIFIENGTAAEGIKEHYRQVARTLSKAELVEFYAKMLPKNQALSSKLYTIREAHMKELRENERLSKLAEELDNENEELRKRLGCMNRSHLPTFSYTEAKEYMNHIVFVDEALEFISLLHCEKKRYSLLEIQDLFHEIETRLMPYVGSFLK